MPKKHSFPLRSRLARSIGGLPLGKHIVSTVRMFWGNGGPDDQWQRIVLNREVRRMVDVLHPNRLEVLEISGSNWPTTGYFKTLERLDFPTFDICQQRSEKQYDLIIAEQVFEHLLWPYRAGRNVFEMLRPNGFFLIATPFMLKIHECPYDCTRWTPIGMKYFLAECGFPLDHIETHAWGNRACVRANFPRWPIYQPWRHSLKNEYEFPIQVWALAKKVETIIHS